MKWKDYTRAQKDAYNLAERTRRSARPAKSIEPAAPAVQFTAEEIAALQTRQNEIYSAFLSANTQRGYRFDWLSFEVWCGRAQKCSLPAAFETVALYITEQIGSGRKVSTVTRRVCAVGSMHRSKGFPNPVTSEVRGLLAACMRLRPQTLRQVLPLSLDQLRTISALLAVDNTAISLRNRALMVIGFTSALRSANIASLAMGDVEVVAGHGLLLTVGKEKQDQEGHGRFIGLPRGANADTCPVQCLDAWLAHRGKDPGPLFTRLDNQTARLRVPLQPERIGQVVQQCVERIGLDARLYCSHSLRAGFITTAGECGAGELLVAAQSGHKDMTVLRRYFRRQDVWHANACAMIGL